MEYSLTEIMERNDEGLLSLNPYSNGILSDFTKRIKTIFTAVIVLILILMEYSLTI